MREEKHEIGYYTLSDFWIFIWFFLVLFFYLFITNDLSSNTTIGAFIAGLITEGIALVDSIVFRSKIERIAEGKEASW